MPMKNPPHRHTPEISSGRRSLNPLACPSQPPPLRFKFPAPPCPVC
jgi:hypothetical protein